jgi:hypothetical protein
MSAQAGDALLPARPSRLSLLRAGLAGRVLPLLPLLVAAGLCLPRLAGPIDLRYDAGVYYLLGTALAEGKGYRLPNEPGEIQAVQYPPLLPLLVAAHQKVLGTADPAAVGPALRFTFLAMFLAYIAAVVRLARSWLTEGGESDGRLAAWLATAVGLVTALYLYSYFLSDLCFSEIPFALVTVLFFLVDLRGRREGKDGRAAAWGSGALAAAAYLLRTQGIALLAAWVGAALLERRWRRALGRAALALVPVLAWQGYVAAVRSAPEYGQVAYEYQRAPYQFYNVDYRENLTLADPFAPEKGLARLTDLGRTVGRNLQLLPVSLGEAVSSKRDFWQMQRQYLNRLKVLPWLPARLEVLALGGLGLLVLAGLALFAVRRQWLILLYVAASAAMICLTPWPKQFPRYFAPLTPFLALALAGLVARLAGQGDQGERRHPAPCPSCPPGWRRWAGVAGLTLFAGLAAEQALTAYQMFGRYHRPALFLDAGGHERGYRLFFYDRSWQALEEGLKRLRHLPPGERGTVATMVPHWVYLWTGLPAVFPPFEPDPAEAQRLLDGVPIAYAIADDFDFLPMSDRYLEPTLAAFPWLWEPVYASGDGAITVYRRSGPRPTLPPAARAAP